MASWLWITCFALLVMEAFAGIVTNGFIVLINCIDWFRRRKLSTTDLILICLSLSRLMWQATVTVHVTVLSFFPHIYKLNHGYLILSTIWLFMNNITLWLATWLSVLYFVKIATFSHPVFLQVKLRFSGTIPWLLLSSVIYSAFMAIIVVIELRDLFDICDSYKLHFNTSCDSAIERPPSYRIAAVFAPDFMPSVIFLSSMILLMISLWKHIRHLQCNGIGTRDLSTQVHLTAIKALASFAVLYLTCFVITISQSIQFWAKNDNSWRFMFLQNVAVLCPSLHAVLLILINPKLKQAWDRMIQRLKCLSKETPS